MAKGFVFRFAVGSEHGPRGSMWRLWSNQNEVYLAHADRGKIEKLSFHKSGICRRAFTNEYPTPNTLPDRLMQRWQRVPGQTPSTENFSYAAALVFPTDFLSTTLEPSTKKEITWITPAPEHESVVVAFFFTREDEVDIKRVLTEEGKTFIGSAILPNGETFVMSGHVERFEGQEMLIPASHGSLHDMVISRSDPEATGRPVRFTMFRDGTAVMPLVVTEYGAFQVAIGTGTRGREGMGVLTRDRVIERSKGSGL